MFDTTLQVLDIRALEVEEGAEHAVLVMMTGTTAQVPVFIDGQQHVAQVPVPIGVLRVPMSRDVTLALSESLKTEGEKLKKPSDILVPGSMQDADTIANVHKQMRGQ